MWRTESVWRQGEGSNSLGSEGAATYHGLDRDVLQHRAVGEAAGRRGAASGGRGAAAVGDIWAAAVLAAVLLRLIAHLRRPPRDGQAGLPLVNNIIVVVELADTCQIIR